MPAKKVSKKSAKKPSSRGDAKASSKKVIPVVEEAAGVTEDNEKVQGK